MRLPMIDIALKHCIYETCINVLFDGIEKNFVPPIIPWEKLHTYGRYRYIKAVINNNTHFFRDVFILGKKESHGMIEGGINFSHRRNTEGTAGLTKESIIEVVE